MSDGLASIASDLIWESACDYPHEVTTLPASKVQQTLLAQSPTTFVSTTFSTRFLRTSPGATLMTSEKAVTGSRMGFATESRLSRIFSLKIRFASISTLTASGLVQAMKWVAPFDGTVAELLNNGVHVLLYVGDADSVCNWAGNKAWIDALDWNGKVAPKEKEKRLFEDLVSGFNQLLQSSSKSFRHLQRFLSPLPTSPSRSPFTG
ncbi:unnamed protein product [Phytophthora lilii]|uniref:Unnamed protein product n=1 Tax=Phytophthora lilii TaxID=2077276 RepID=A0A9W6X994_9STRA|nr:unnamed protein product [Phytophthora lilii]